MERGRTSPAEGGVSQSRGCQHWEAISFTSLHQTKSGWSLEHGVGEGWATTVSREEAQEEARLLS